MYHCRLPRMLDVSMRGFSIEEFNNILNSAFLWIDGRESELFPSELIFVFSMTLLSFVVLFLRFNLGSLSLLCSIFFNWFKSTILF